MIQYSVVIPIYNEEEILPELYQRLEKVMGASGASYEIVFVSDGSRDRSMELIRGMAAKNPSVKCVELSRNFGLQPAYSAGIDHASGEAVVLMDGDLQDPPELIPQLIAKLNEGYDVVYTVKTRRKEDAFKRFLFASFYRILRMISTVDMPLDAGSFSIMTRRVANIFTQLPEKQRLISGIRAWVGYKQTGLSYDRDARFAGPPRQSMRRLFRMALDGIFAFSAAPVRAAAFLGMGLVLLSGLAGLLLVWSLFCPCAHRIPSAAWILDAVVFFGGIQLMFLGAVGEYVWRIFEQVKDRPIYLIKEKIGFKP